MKNSTEKTQTYWRGVLERFTRHKLAVVGLFFLVLLVICAIFLPCILHLDPYTSDTVGGFNQAPSAAHWLGTDSVGRDIFARVVYGGRVSLGVGLLSTIVAMMIGIPLGLLAGYFRGWIETVVMRLADIFMSFPSTMLLLVMVAVFGRSVIILTVILGVLGWTQFARLMYSSVLSVREKEYVESAKAIGTKNLGVMLKYILPNSLSPCLIVMTSRTASSIMMEASLSFLGFGVQPPMASWGNLMYDAKSITVLSTQPWVWVPTGICLVITVLSINFFGDGLRDALDPKMKV